ncbi:hypothetical protein QYM36_010185 [Artemia franciscana]|uniref:Major facilitator superfamily (MFS) profile domain-containing protein n=1 Tax=Artemia franciscana TaxID=6661 RepID=A0AA88HUU1_ARTSF|nr:hypothetical protein QYM36_010185 [Artemia franciscana]
MSDVISGQESNCIALKSTKCHQTLGSLGRYQWQQYFLHVLPAFTAGVHMLSQVTVGASPDHKCISPLPLNSSELEDVCYVETEEGLEKCMEWEYDQTYYGSTIVTEWDLVCDRRWMRAAAQSIFMFGVLFGAAILGPMADKYGRMKIFYASSVLQVLFGVGAAFCYHYIAFVICKFFLGMFGSAGAYVTGFVLTMEMVGPKYRTALGFGMQAIFDVGGMVVAGWGVLIKDWNLLQLVYGLHGAILLGHWWLTDESVYWLYTKGEKEKAKEIVQKGMKVNKLKASVSESDMEKIFSVADTKEKYGIMDLLRTPRMRLRILNVCLNWFANSIVFYGLSLNTDTLLKGDPFLMLFLVTLPGLPSYVLTPILVDRFGRRDITSTFMMVGGLACIIAAFIPKDTTAGSTAVITMVMIGKFFIAGSFAIIYNYTAELFPTVVRSSAMGSGAMCARLSGALTPLISLLDSFDPKLPSVIFGTISLISGFLTLFLPETLGKTMPQTLEEGESLGLGDRRRCFGSSIQQNERASVASDTV